MKRASLILAAFTMTVLVAFHLHGAGTNTAAAQASKQPAAAQMDAAKVDPKHYKVEFENDTIRVLRVTYGPHEKSPMHRHPANVQIILTDGQNRQVLPDGKAEVTKSERGSVGSAAAATHSMENIGDQRFEAFVIELKGKDQPN